MPPPTWWHQVVIPLQVPEGPAASSADWGPRPGHFINYPSFGRQQLPVDAVRTAITLKVCCCCISKINKEKDYFVVWNYALGVS